MHHNRWTTPILVVDRVPNNPRARALESMGVEIKLIKNLPDIENLKHASDLIRFKLLYQTGGLYFDHDTITIGNFYDLYHSSNKLMFSSSGEQFEFSIGALLAPTPKNPFLAGIIKDFNNYQPTLNNLYSIIRPTRKFLQLYESPELDQRDKELKDSVLYIDPVYFYPMKWNKIRLSKSLNYLNTTLQIHLYNGIIDLSEVNEYNWMSSKHLFAQAYQMSWRKS